ncbi:alpha/beta fold hydrolase [Saccharothrix sp.]|uniref:alpha/beta fold hydrolase n=1 Tax=Saccharothrix sp. TaxID=1873460 RepID=UPI002810FD9E|nr:alpha/beta fold hydrolase [Saccharothrix sp.]
MIKFWGSVVERVARSGSVVLWSEALGEPGGVPVLLVMGANAPAHGWPDEFVALLVEGGCRVVRYDHRDTGRSTRVPDGDYGMGDLAEDAVEVLDAHGIEQAHVVGMSMGGIIAQLLAVDHADRVRTLTLMHTGALDMGSTEDVVPLEGARLERMIALAVPGEDLESELARRVELWRELHGDGLPFDAAEYRRLEERAVAHAGTFEPSTAHVRLGGEPLPRGADDLRRVSVPALVVQGELDPFYPPGMGRHLAALLGARLLEVPGMGHALPAAVHRTVADAILEHIRG